MQKITETGKTVDIAVENALKKLGLSRDDVTVEVLEMPIKKFIGGKPAKVELTVIGSETESDNEQATKETVKTQPKTEALKQDIKENSDLPAAQSDKAKAAVEFLTDVSTKMGIENVLITAVKQGESTILKVDGKNVGALIGRRGETMEALSYLTGLVANRAGGDYEKISLDVGGYRSKREQDLVELAKRIGEKVATTGRSHMLEPMNPYERRIIHSTISEMENVKSESTGEGADRRIVISCTGANAQTGYSTSSYRENDSHSPRRTYNKPQAERPFKPLRPNTNTRPVDRAPRSDFNRDKKFDKPKSAEVASTRTETINDAVDVGLYGKIEL